MYWVVNHETDDEGTEWRIYNYFEVVPVVPRNYRASFNPITRQHSFSQCYDLVIKAAMAKSEAEFMSWYEINKNL